MSDEKFKLYRESAIPLYKQVSNKIQSQIAEGYYKPGDRIPSELELIDEFEVSRITIRAAINALVESGDLERRPGKGTFVTSGAKVETFVHDTQGLTAACRAAGKKLESKVLSLNRVPPTSHDKKILKLDKDDRVIELRRLRLIENHRSVYEINHFKPEFTFLFDEDLTSSLYNIFESHGMPILRQCQRRLDIVYATSNEASILGIEKGYPLLQFFDESSTIEGKPLYITRQIYNTKEMIIYI